MSLTPTTSSSSTTSSYLEKKITLGIYPRYITIV